MQKKILPYTLIAAVLIVGAFCLWRYMAQVKRSPRGDPERAVKGFMDSAVRINGLVWDEKERENLRENLEAWLRSREADNGEPPEILAMYDMGDPTRFFVRADHGKAVLSSLVLYEFDEYEIRKPIVTGTAAQVDVVFWPKDILGLKQAVTEMGAPVEESESRPLSLTFHLRKKYLTWSVTHVEGDLTPLAESLERMRQFE